MSIKVVNKGKSKIILTVFIILVVLIIFGLGNIISFCLGLGVGTSIFDGSSQKTTVAAGSKVLVVNPQGSLFEDNWWSDTRSFDSNSIPNSYLFDITESIRFAIKDKTIKSIVLDLSDFKSGNYSQLAEIVDLLKQYKTTQRPVYAWSSSWNQSSYYLASIADEIKMGAMGELVFSGLSAQSLFYGDFLKKFDLDMQVFRVGDYKSAVEPWMRSEYSTFSKNNLKIWLNQLWNFYLEDISTNRNIELSVLEHYSNDLTSVLKEYKGSLEDAVVKLGLIDSVIAQSAEEGFSAAYPALEGENVFFQDYINSRKISRSSKIAVLTVDGAIGNGYPQSPGKVGSSRFYEQCNKVFSDSEVKAVVLRVNSPGGSAYASEQIRLAIKGASCLNNKPVVVSMSGMAASGGYWISMAGSHIFCNKGTITGSIGAFSMVPNFENLLEKRLSIHHDGVSRTPFGSFSSTQALNKTQIAYFQYGIESLYDHFVSLVADARNLSKEAVLKTAGGRVFTGKTAILRGLADDEGGLYDAIDLAAKLAKLEIYQIEFNKRKKGMGEIFIEEMMGKAIPFIPSQAKVSNQSNSQLESFLQDHNQLLWLLNNKDPKKAYLWLPIDLLL